MLSFILIGAYFIYGLTFVIASKILYISETQVYTGSGTISFDPVKIGFQTAMGIERMTIDPDYGYISVTHTSIIDEYSETKSSFDQVKTKTGITTKSCSNAFDEWKDLIDAEGNP